MATTITHSIYYPSGSQAPNVPVVMQTAAESVDAAITAAKVHPMGHMGKTDGFQAITSLAKNTFSAAQILRGDVTFSNADDALVIGTTGIYRINFQVYATGDGAGTQKGIVYVGNTQIGIGTRYFKEAFTDTVSHGTGLYLLTAGDKVSLHSEHAGASLSSWGSTGYNGTYLEVEYIQP
ncbi:hypothetical protein [Arthrobacter sp. Soil762]|uniref:hypothetical protein n=1 Tax=Arthrobacter sp. Soil762 TaxID=1736401 RepID=UPI000B28EEF6|nr:hypothetical protein [Arthrobacter sp. Soil762]